MSAALAHPPIWYWTMRVVCAWCKRDIRTIQCQGTRPPVTVSHGICEDCARREYPDRRRA